MTALFIIILIILVILVVLILPQLLLRRAINQVIRIFRRKNATSPQMAATVEELRLQRKTFLQSLMTTRDYKPSALDALINLGIVIATEDGKLYLSEEKLQSSPLGRKMKLPRF